MKFFLERIDGDATALQTALVEKRWPGGAKSKLSILEPFYGRIGNF